MRAADRLTVRPGGKAQGDPHQALLRRQWALEVQALEQRRQRVLAAAEMAAWALRQQWPSIEAVWLFGSAQSPGGFRRHSDLDLAVAGLPSGAEIAAMGLLEQLLDSALMAAGEAAIGIDVVRLEDLPPHWRQRICLRASLLA